MLQQYLADLLPAVEGGQVDAVPPRVYHLVHVRPVLEQDANHPRLALVAGRVEGRPLLAVQGVRLRAVVQQELHNVRVTVHGCQVQRYPQVVGLDGGVRPFVQEEPHDLNVTLLGREVEGRPAVLVLEVHVDAPLHEELGHLPVPVEGAQVEGVASHLDDGVDGPAVLQQQPRRVQVTLVARRVERRPLLPVGHVDVRVPRYQVLHDGGVARRGGHVQGPAPAVGGGLHVHPAVHEQHDDLKGPLLGGQVEGGPAFVVARPGLDLALEKQGADVGETVEGGQVEGVPAPADARVDGGPLLYEVLGQVVVVVVAGDAEGGPLPRVLHVDPGPVVQEVLDNVPLALHAGEVDRGTQVVRLDVCVRPAQDQLLDYLQVALLGAQVERGPALLVLDRPVRPVVQEHLRYLGPPVVAGGVEGDALVLGAGVDADVRLIQEELDYLLVALLHRQMQGAPVVLVLEHVVDPFLQQELGHRRVPFESGQVEAVASAVDGLVDLGPPRDQEPRYLVVAVLAGDVEGRPLLRVLGGDVGAVLEEVGGHLGPPLEDGVVQRGPPVVGPHVGVHAFAVLGQEEGHNLEVSLLGRQVEGGPPVPVAGRHQLPVVGRGDDVLDALEVPVEGGGVDRVASRLAGEGKVRPVVAYHLDDVGVTLL